MSSLVASPNLSKDRPAQSPQTNVLASDEHVTEFLLPPSHIQIAPEQRNFSLDDEPEMNLTTLDRKCFFLDLSGHELEPIPSNLLTPRGDSMTYNLYRS